jgi:hypothetical protein
VGHGSYSGRVRASSAVLRSQETLYITSLATVPTIASGEQAGSETRFVEGVLIRNVARASPGYLTERDEDFEMFGVISGTTTELLDIWLARSPASKEAKASYWHGFAPSLLIKTTSGIE